MTIGDRCKEYEELTESKLIRKLPTFARLDGRSFHSFTKGMKRPFDEEFHFCVSETTRALVEEFQPLIGYTQSDEITMFWAYEDDIAETTKMNFGGRVQKLTSVLAGFASSKFMQLVQQHFPAKASKIPCFDCRIWQVPTKGDALEVFLWREDDATKNSITMAAQSVYSHKELHGKNSSDKQEMLFQKGINWNDYPSHFKRGAFFKRENYTKEMTIEEYEKIPSKKRPKDRLITRSHVVELDLGPIRQNLNFLEKVYE